MPNNTKKGLVTVYTDAHEDLAVYDRLPADIRKELREASVDIAAIEARNALLIGWRPWQVAAMVRDTSQQEAAAWKAEMKQIRVRLKG